MLRDDGQRCCCKTPCKWLSTFVCCACCQDGMSVYAGELADDKEKGRPFNPDPSKLIGTVTQPVYGGVFTPTLHLTEANSAQPFAKVEGPCFFGGWSEMCCSFNFAVSRFESEKRVGDLAKVVKKKPDSFAGGMKELMTEADVYGVTFNEGVELTAAQKITVLTSQVLADYMWFEGNTEKCKSDDGGITCNCCFYSCFGAVCPVSLWLPVGGKKKGHRHRHR